MIFGNPAKFGFEWVFDSTHELANLAWGRLAVSINGESLWQDNDNQPIEWTWLDLVEWVGSCWKYICYETKFPYGLSPSHPKQLDLARWIKAQGFDFDSIEDEIFQFQARHDLSYAMKGIHLPSVWFIPEGGLVRIHAQQDNLVVWLTLFDFQEILTKLVESILMASKADNSGRHVLAQSNWHKREPDTDTKIRISTGLTLDEISTLAGTLPNDEIMAAARLSVALPLEVRRELFANILAVDHRPTVALDELSEQAEDILFALHDKPPHEQGYRMALWLRKSLGVSDTVDPEEVIKSWGVEVKTVELADDRVDAVACWGPDHGPAVILNTRGKHVRSIPARRATLAHEIAHLLIDRGATLPFAEVLGGNVPDYIEKRARAFAAEFLMPREIVDQVLLSALDFTEGAKQLRRNFRVSNELLGWQILNGQGKSRLSEQDLAKVQKWTRIVQS